MTRPSTVETMLQLGRLYEEVMPGRYFAHVLNKIDLKEDPAVTATIDRLKASKVPLFRTSAVPIGRFMPMNSTRLPARWRTTRSVSSQTRPQNPRSIMNAQASTR